MTRLYGHVAVFAAIVFTSAVCQAQADTLVSRALAPGVAYRQFVDKAGRLVAYVVRIDLRDASIELQHVRAHNALQTRERPTAMVRRLTETGANVLAAMNADFFNLQTGENENNQVVAGEWWKGLKNTDSPYDTYDNAHVQFGLDANRRPVMDRFMFDGTAWAHGTATPIITLNFFQRGNPEGTVLYTPRFGANTPRDTARVVEAPMVSAGRKGDTVVFVRRGAIDTTSGSAIPRDGAVLVAYGAGPRQNEVKAMADGDTVKVLLATIPRLRPAAAPSLIIGGWPRILRDGAVVAAEAPVVEGTISRNAEARHPRTAIGFSRDSSTLYLLAVDGRSEKSVGVTLVELAALMRKLGAWQAMNFDGGGSTTVVIDGAVVNVPSDTSGEREVGNALVVIRKR